VLPSSAALSFTTFELNNKLQRGANGEKCVDSVDGVALTLVPLLLVVLIVAKVYAELDLLANIVR